MVGKRFVTPTKGGCLIRVDVTTGGARTEIAGLNEWRGAIQIRLAAEPVKGEANAELIRYLSERLSIPAKSIEIVTGRRSSHKQVRLPVDPAKMERIVGVM